MRTRQDVDARNSADETPSGRPRAPFEFAVQPLLRSDFRTVIRAPGRLGSDWTRVLRDGGPGGRGYSKICSDVGNLARHRVARSGPGSYPEPGWLILDTPGEAGQLPVI